MNMTERDEGASKHAPVTAKLARLPRSEIPADCLTQALKNSKTPEGGGLRVEESLVAART